ncbi:class I SAM-dependent methyltransferase [Rhodoblastus acidophilus]|uniref:Class I SAM-dependent methyltransferase n=1 Tax=Candidatus Rhodoblastus alkanivorans TaxID=2954117 RepID=A0ABS9Z7E7_9HYPH|nr:class I SAM-dependent methyltransferase [Candidatus Rhodoblastus alkanivorans]MCI4680298.1 class I SAM-dependent methyltransferase [Candidatus Rhodoblastus alkanivorans]MCI4683117.1 class I SAM-dependent methyltransferase [Candidatus Rhodoblastus alkanivorans]MDI4640428.1 class I SAM-dependent methyltransferase [Rhodoblastus acidophilus]
MKVIGAIDIADNTQVAGWLAGEEFGESRFVRIFVDNAEIGTAIARNFRQDLKDKKISDGNSGFRFIFPRPLDPLVGHDIRVEDRDTGIGVRQTNVRLPSVISANTDGKESFFGFDKNFVNIRLRDGFVKDGVWTIWPRVIGPADFKFDIVCTGAEINEFKVSSERSPYWSALGLQEWTVKIVLTPEANVRYVVLKLTDDSELANRCKAVCSVAVPAKIPSYITSMTVENVTRVSGPTSTIEQFAVSGFNTAYRLNEILKAHFRKEFRDFKNCLDWGIGAGRVALPIKHYFAPDLRLVGTDIDDFNIEFGQKSYPELEFVRSRLLPPLPFADQLFDTVYGISVFTHLTEGVQFAWLEELRRVVKTGSPVIMTVHSEMALFDVSRSRGDVLLEVSKFGFSDSLIDTNLGSKLEAQTYYRSTFHGRKYILEKWSKYFDILACYTSANVGVQDYIVMRAK